METNSYNKFLQEGKDFENKHGAGVMYIWQGKKRYTRIF